MKNLLLLMTLLAFAGCSDATDDSDPIAPTKIQDSSSLKSAERALSSSAKADGPDIRIQGDRVFIYGEVAQELRSYSERYFQNTVTESGGATYVRSALGLCAFNATTDVCVLGLDARNQQDGYKLTFGGSLLNPGTAATKAYYITQALLLSQGSSSVLASGRNFVSSATIDCAVNLSGRASTAFCGFKNDSAVVVTPPPAEKRTIVSLRAENLESLGEDFVYEGWLIVNGQPLTAGRFDGSGDTTFDFEIEGDLTASTLYILTIEPKFNDDPAPSSTHIIGGALRNNRGVLSVDHRTALGNSFANASGRFILETPSSADTRDYDQGIWFVNPSAGVASLDLPTLPAGWVYEGWVAGPEGPISTGTFLSASGQDSDGAGPTAGPMGTPPFPGQDFINPAKVLIGQMAVISIEPSPDNSPAPFQLKPLVGNIVDAGAGQLQNMNTDISEFPTGVVSVSYE